MARHYKSKILNDGAFSEFGKKVVIYDEFSLTIDVPSSAFLHSLSKSGKSIHTINSYASVLSRFLNKVVASPLVGSWENITDNQMRTYLEHDRAKQLKPSSLKSTIRQLKKFYIWVYDNGFLDDAIEFTWSLSPETERQLKLQTGRENSRDPFDLFSKYIDRSSFEFFCSFMPRIRTFEKERDELILYLGYESGWRRSETVDPYNISISKINKALIKSEKEGFDGFYLTIIGKGEGGGKVREVYIPPALKGKIKRFIAGVLKRTVSDTNLLICKRDGSALHHGHATDLFSDTLSNLLSTASIDAAKVWLDFEEQRSFHCLRHSYATNFADYLRKSGKPKELLKERMGHSDYVTTLIYIHFNALRNSDNEYADEVWDQIVSTGSFNNLRLVEDE